MMRTTVRRLCGQASGAPSAVAAQSNARMRAPISPPPSKNAAALRESMSRDFGVKGGDFADAGVKSQLGASVPKSAVEVVPGRTRRLVRLPDGDRLPLRPEVRRRRLAAVCRAHVVGDDLLELLGDVVALEGDGLLAVDEDRRDRDLARARQADAHVRHLRLA